MGHIQTFPLRVITSGQGTSVTVSGCHSNHILLKSSFYDLGFSMNEEFVLAQVTTQKLIKLHWETRNSRIIS